MMKTENLRCFILYAIDNKVLRKNFRQLKLNIEKQFRSRINKFSLELKKQERVQLMLLSLILEKLDYI